MSNAHFVFVLPNFDLYVFWERSWWRNWLVIWTKKNILVGEVIEDFIIGRHSQENENGLVEIPAVLLSKKVILSTMMTNLLWKAFLPLALSILFSKTNERMRMDCEPDTVSTFSFQKTLSLHWRANNKSALSFLRTNLST